MIPYKESIKSALNVFKHKESNINAEREEVPGREQLWPITWSLILRKLTASCPPATKSYNTVYTRALESYCLLGQTLDMLNNLPVVSHLLSGDSSDYFRGPDADQRRENVLRTMPDAQPALGKG